MHFALFCLRPSHDSLNHQRGLLLLLLLLLLHALLLLLLSVGCDRF